MEFNFAHNSDELMHIINWIIEKNFYRHINDDNSAELRWLEGIINFNDVMAQKKFCTFLKEDADNIIASIISDNTLNYNEYARQYDLAMKSIRCLNIFEKMLNEIVRRALLNTNVSSFNIEELKYPK